MRALAAEVDERRVRASGPRVAWAFQKLLSLIFLIAWLSIGSQIQLLIGSRGLLPFAPLREQLLEGGIGFSRFPSLLLYAPSDLALTALVVVGCVLALASLFGVWPRLMFGINTLLYLSCANAGQSFLSFQWDNLLLECGLLATFLRSDRPQPWVHFLFRVLLFKLYFESGIAKYQSYLGDWQDGSAMSHYYETAPIPTAFAWFMHHLPAAWHRLESWLTLTWEILVPFLIFSPRKTRLLAALVFTLFQTINVLTANYGFFCYLAFCLQVFLLCDGDLERFVAHWHRRAIRLRRHWVDRGYPLRRWTARYRLSQRATQRLIDKLTPRIPATTQVRLNTPRRVATALLVTTYLSVSINEGLDTFWPEKSPKNSFFQEAQALYAPFRLINTYHLFGQITPERIEPEFQLYYAGDFHPLTFKYKPGPVTRAPPFVSPYHPRLDFQLWFYGLSYRQGTPAYVFNLLQRLCRDPQIVAPLFTTRLPQNPEAVRISFYKYTFTSFAEWRQTGAWWNRELIDQPRTRSCARR